MDEPSPNENLLVNKILTLLTEDISGWSANAIEQQYHEQSGTTVSSMMGIISIDNVLVHPQWQPQIYQALRELLIYQKLKKLGEDGPVETPIDRETIDQRKREHNDL